MSHKIVPTLLLSCALFAAVCHADVSSLRYDRFGRPIASTRLQRQELAATPYPAAGYRPDRQFALPAQFFPAQQTQPESNFNAGNVAAAEESQQRPELTYGAPARLRQSPARQQLQPQPRNFAAPQQAYAAAPQAAFADAPQQIYGAPEQTPVAAPEPQAERLTALKSARLSDNREDQEDEDDVESNAEVDEKMAEEEKKPVVAAVPTAAPAGSTVAYYPAGAVNFVQPLSAYVQPGSVYNAASANYFAKLQVQPATYVASAPLTAAAAAPAAAAPAAVAPVAQLAQFVQPQQAFASPFFQQFAYAAPAQLRAW